jgi:hypothetical protein
MKHDEVNHPKYYNQDDMPCECIEITKHFNFCLGSAIKYIWRHRDKNNPIKDLRKAIWYIEKEIEELKEEERRYEEHIIKMFDEAMASKE